LPQRERCSQGSCTFSTVKHNRRVKLTANGRLGLDAGIHASRGAPYAPSQARFILRCVDIIPFLEACWEHCNLRLDGQPWEGVTSICSVPWALLLHSQLGSLRPPSWAMLHTTSNGPSCTGLDLDQAWGRPPMPLFIPISGIKAFVSGPNHMLSASPQGFASFTRAS
jgi:hypothetical protein